MIKDKFAAQVINIENAFVFTGSYQVCLKFFHKILRRRRGSMCPNFRLNNGDYTGISTFSRLNLFAHTPIWSQ